MILKEKLYSFISCVGHQRGSIEGLCVYSYLRRDQNVWGGGACKSFIPQATNKID